MNIFKKWKQRKQYKINLENYKKLQQDMQRAVQVLIQIDNELKKHHTRQYRRRFWYDFYRNHKVRKEIFLTLLKQYEINIEVLKNKPKRKKVRKTKKKNSTKELKIGKSLSGVGNLSPEKPIPPSIRKIKEGF